MTIEDVEQGLGLLISSGWTLEECLALSWVQLAVCIRCVVRVKSEQARMVMETIAIAMGGKVKKSKKPNRSTSRENDRQVGAAGAGKEDAFLSSIAAAGVRVHESGTANS